MKRSMRNSLWGFTLLETMVALVIFSGSAMALAGLINTNLLTLSRVREVNAQIPVVHNAIAEIRALNLATAQQGRFDLNDYVIRWQATLLEPKRQSQNRDGYIGYHEVGIYDVVFTLSRDNVVVGTYTLRHTGFETVRGPSL